MKFKKLCAGNYVSECGRWSVATDHVAVSAAEADGGGLNAGVATSVEWGVYYDRLGRLWTDSTAGDVLGWVDTLREGKALAERLASVRGSG